MGLGQFDAAKECYESLRAFGDNTTADSYLKKLGDAQERDAYNMQHTCSIVLAIQYCCKFQSKSWTIGNIK